MAKQKGRFGQQSRPDYAGNVLKDINRMNATGNTAAPAGTTDGTAVKMKAKEKRAAFTADEVTNSEYLSALKTGLSTLTYEQALANFRAQQNALNLSPLAGKKASDAQIAASQAALAKINANPLTKYASDIFFKMGGSTQESEGSKYGGYGIGTADINTYKSLGLTPPSVNYAPVMTSTSQAGNKIVTNIANPLNPTQKSALQRLRALGNSGATLSEKQVARLNKLKALKNAPKILP